MGRLGYLMVEYLFGWGEREINRCLLEEEGILVFFIILVYFFLFFCFFCLVCCCFLLGSWMVFVDGVGIVRLYGVL